MNQKVQHSDPVKAIINGIEIVYDTFGKQSATPMLLVMGLGAQMIAWDEDLCEELAAYGYWVIRFDNRDVGLSTRFDEAGIPDIPAMIQAQRQGEALASPYTLRDMADDAVGLLDAIGVRKHTCGGGLNGRYDRSGNGDPSCTSNSDGDIHHVVDGKSSAASPEARGFGGPVDTPASRS